MASRGREGVVAQSNTFLYWPDNPFWSFQILRLVAEAIGGGADFTEWHLAARKMRVGNDEDWYSGFMALGAQVEGLADDALAGGHLITARDCYLRAANYYRTAEFFLKPRDERKEGAYLKCRAAFNKATPYFSPPMEYVDIPYEGTALFGHFYHPKDAKPGPYKVLILLGGADSVVEELYFAAAKACTERGIACLAVDGPGQGASLRLRKIYSRYDYEVPIKAVVDYLETREDVDPNRIALVGASLGGYYAPRAAAFEKRLKACIAWGALYDVTELFPNLPDFFVDQYGWFLGTNGFEETLAACKQLTLKGVIDKISCPLLIVHGEEDRLVPVAQAYRAYEEARCDKTLKVFKTGEPGVEHCQLDAITALHYYMFNWLEDKLS